MRPSERREFDKVRQDRSDGAEQLRRAQADRSAKHRMIQALERRVNELTAELESAAKEREALVIEGMTAEAIDRIVEGREKAVMTFFRGALAGALLVALAVALMIPNSARAAQTDPQPNWAAYGVGPGAAVHYYLADENGRPQRNIRRCGIDHTCYTLLVKSVADQDVRVVFAKVDRKECGQGYGLVTYVNASGFESSRAMGTRGGSSRHDILRAILCGA